MLIVALLIAAAAVPPAAPVAHSASSPRKADDAVMRRGDAYGWLIQARLALQRGRSLDVVRAVQEATALLPKDADLLAEGAGLLLGAGRREQAEAMAREALAAQPPIFIGFCARGTLPRMSICTRTISSLSALPLRRKSMSWEL